MTAPDRFDEYVAEGAHRLLPPALRLTGDPMLAEELVRDTLARARRRWPQIEADPEPPLVAMLEATYSARWRARNHGSDLDRLGAVRERIRQVRTRRLRVAAGAVVVLLLIFGYAAMPPGRTPAHRADPSASATTPAPLPPPMQLVEGFPEYKWGARVVAAKAARTPARSLSFTVTPTTLRLVLFERCSDDVDGVSLNIKTSVNGRPFGGGGCGGMSRLDDWSELGLRIGEPATFTMTVRGAERYDEDAGAWAKEPVPDGATFALAIGERMAYPDYPLPLRPASLRPLEDPGFNGTDATAGTHAIRSDPDHPAREMSLIIDWRGDLDLNMGSQTPGFLHVSVDGREVSVGEWWDYDQGGWGMSIISGEGGVPRLKKGQPVTITVRPEHVTGEWLVNLWPHVRY